MSTDFSLDALLNGSTSSTSVISPDNNKPSSSTTVTSLDQLILKTLSTPPPEDQASSVCTKAKKSKGKGKRKREDSDDEKENTNTDVQPKKKRIRTAFTRQQLQRLEFAFAQNQYPDMLMRENIAEELGLPAQKVHVWFQNRRAKLRRLRGQPAAVFPPPAVVCPSLQYQCPPTSASSLKVPHPSITPPSVYLKHQQHVDKHTYQSVGVQAQNLGRVELSPSPSPIHFTMQERRSLSRTPSVSPYSTPTGSPSMLQIVSPPSNGAASLYPPTCGVVLPARTSPPSSAMPLPISANQLSLRQGVSLASPIPYYCPPQTTSAASSVPMYFLDMTPPLSDNRVNAIIPPFPKNFQV